MVKQSSRSVMICLSILKITGERAVKFVVVFGVMAQPATMTCFFMRQTITTQRVVRPFIVVERPSHAVGFTFLPRLKRGIPFVSLVQGIDCVALVYSSVNFSTCCVIQRMHFISFDFCQFETCHLHDCFVLLTYQHVFLLCVYHVSNDTFT